MTDNYEKINRFKVVPCIIDGDFKLSESIAILRYLDETQRGSDSLYPKDAKQRARIDEYLEWQHLNTRAGCSGFFREQFILPLLTGKPSDENQLNWIKKMRDGALKKIETVWLTDSAFIAGDKLTAADLFAATEIEQISKD